MADSFEKFLSKNQPKTNQNQKFVDSSPVASVFSRLGFDFVPSDPAILELSPGVKKHLEQTPKLIKDWQAEDMRNGTASRESYYKNPVFNVSKSLQNSLQKIKDSIPVIVSIDYGSGQIGGTEMVTFLIPEFSEIYEQSNIAISQLEQFINHTNRLSNVVDITPETSELPHYQQAMAVGRQLMYVVYQTDNIQNNAPILGTFTSLFVGTELVDYNEIIETYPSQIKNSITITIGEGGEVYTTNLTSTQIDTIVNNIKVVKNLVEKRRKHDENFWNKAQIILDEYQMLKSMNDGEFQKTILNGYVGTEDLKEKLVVKDVPVEPSYNVKVQYDGTIIYEPRKPDVNAISYPEFVDRTVATENTVDYFDELPEPVLTNGIVDTFNSLPKDSDIQDTYYISDTSRTYRWNGLDWYQIESHVIGDTTYITTTGQTYRWNGKEWVLISEEVPKSPVIALDDYIQIYSSNSINISFDGYSFNLSVGAFSLQSNNGLWSANADVVIYNTGTKDYSFTGISVTSFLNTEVRYSMNLVNSNTIFYNSDPNIFGTVNAGESVIVTVSARNLLNANTVDYGRVTVVPGIELPVKVVSNVAQYGVLLPSAVTQNVGSSDARLLINQVNGPYRLLAPDSADPDFWTWRNDSNDSVTIASVTDITPNTHNTDMTIQLYQANTPNTLNVNDSVLWYANVTPHVEFPNTFIYKVTTSDGQERLLTIGIDPGNVDDSNLYNEIVNTNPDIVVTNNSFAIRVFGGKPNTFVTLSGPNVSTTKLIDSNGFSLVANTSITSNGTYTYVLNFAGTGHIRTITKAIFS